MHRGFVVGTMPDEFHYPRYDMNSAALRLNMSRSTLQRLRNAGKIKYMRIGGRPMFSEAQIRGFLAEAERCEMPTQRSPRRRQRSAS